MLSDLLNLKKTAIACGVALAIGFGGGLYVHAKFVAADKLKVLQDQVDAYKLKQDSADLAAAAWEKSLADLREATKQSNRRLVNEISSKLIYSSCVVPPDGVRALADAVSGASPGESGKPVPASP